MDPQEGKRLDTASSRAELLAICSPPVLTASLPSDADDFELSAIGCVYVRSAGAVMVPVGRCFSS